MVSLPPQYAATFGNGYSLTVTLSHMGVYTVAKSANTYLNQPFVGIRCDPQVVRDSYARIAPRRTLILVLEISSLLPSTKVVIVQPRCEDPGRPPSMPPLTSALAHGVIQGFSS